MQNIHKAFLAMEGVVSIGFFLSVAFSKVFKVRMLCGKVEQIEPREVKLTINVNGNYLNNLQIINT